MTPRCEVDKWLVLCFNVVQNDMFTTYLCTGLENFTDDMMCE